MSRRVASAWVLFALVGIALGVGVSVAASRLTGEHVALSSEPITAGRDLVPRQAAPQRRPRHGKRQRRRAQQAAPAPSPQTTTTPPSTYTPPPSPAPSAPRSPSPRQGSGHGEHEVEHEDD